MDLVLESARVAFVHQHEERDYWVGDGLSVNCPLKQRVLETPMSGAREESGELGVEP